MGNGFLGATESGRASSIGQAGIEERAAVAAVMHHPLQSQAAPFDGCLDYSKMNSSKHKASRADTFNASSMYKKPSTAGSGSGIGGEASPFASSRPSASARDLIDIFELGISRSMATLRNELREAMDQATLALRKDILSAMADKEGIELINKLDAKVEELLRGPVNINLDPVLDLVSSGNTSIRDTMVGIDSHMVKSNEKLGVLLGEAENRLAEKQDVDEAKRRAWLKDLLEEAEGRSLARLDEVSSKLTSLTASVESSFDEAHRQSSEQLQTLERLEVGAKAARTATSDDLEREVRSLRTRLDDVKSSQRTSLEASAAAAEELAKIRQQNFDLERSLIPSLEATVGRFFESNSVKVDFQEVNWHLMRSQQTMFEEFPRILMELGRIQQAMNLDFTDYASEVEMRYRMATGEIPTIAFGAGGSTPSLGAALPALQAAPPQPAGAMETVSKGCSMPDFGSVMPVPWYSSMASIPDVSRAGSKAKAEGATSLAVPGAGVGAGRNYHSCEDVGGTFMSLPGSIAGISPRLGALGKRLRTFYTQTDGHGKSDGWAQTDSSLGRVSSPIAKHKPRAAVRAGRRAGSHRAGNSYGAPRDSNRLSLITRSDRVVRRSRANIFADSEAMKLKARQALIRPQYNVADFYFTKGIMQKIAKHPMFETITAFMIFLNAIWLAIDIDMNQAATWLQAKPVFMIVENLFCVFFVTELLIRFLAFKEKKRCLKDAWFVFDSILVAMMITETWIFAILVWAINQEDSAGIGGLAIFRIVRIVKMLRISRMVRLLRTVPELFILMKGMKAASRSVFLFFVMWLIIVYVYALVFRTLVSEEIPSTHFASMPDAMNNLLLGGILPAHALFVREVTSEYWLFWPLAISFISLASVLLMNMLIGVLVEVVNAVAATEREGIAALALATDLRAIMQQLGWNTEDPILKTDLNKLFVEAEVAQIIETAGVDVVNLVDNGAIFDEYELDISFEDLVEVILNLRDSNTARVKDVKNQLRAIKAMMKESEIDMRTMVEHEVHHIQSEVKTIRTLAQRQEETEESDMDEDASSRPSIRVSTATLDTE